MTFILISTFLLVLYAGLLWYYRRWWKSIPYSTPLEHSGAEAPFVSVIIAARNEERNIAACLHSLLAQNYPGHLFEIIIADDHSEDRTASIIKSFPEEKIRLIEMASNDQGHTSAHKKKCIETAIRHAKGELILTTDADCTAPPSWISAMVSFYKERKIQFIAAPVVLELPHATDPARIKWLKIFQSLDFMSLQGVTGAAVHKKFHSMCNGANLAYTRTSFYEVEGFKGIDDIASGDDMLLMHKIREKHPDGAGFLKSKDAIITTAPVSTLREFFQQRIRWASKANKYADRKIIAVLLLVYLLNAWMLLLGVASFFITKAFYIFLIAFPVKVIIELFFLFPVARFFRRQQLLWWFVPAQPFHILYIIVAGWMGIFSTYQWKGRKVK